MAIMQAESVSQVRVSGERLAIAPNINSLWLCRDYGWSERLINEIASGFSRLIIGAPRTDYYEMLLRNDQFMAVWNSWSHENDTRVVFTNLENHVLRTLNDTATRQLVVTLIDHFEFTVVSRPEDKGNRAQITEMHWSRLLRSYGIDSGIIGSLAHVIANPKTLGSALPGSTSATFSAVSVFVAQHSPQHEAFDLLHRMLEVPLPR